jgi:hypothetical protein
MKKLFKLLAALLLAVSLLLISKPGLSNEEPNLCIDEDHNEICYKRPCYPIPGFDCYVTPVGGQVGARCGQQATCI